MAASKQFLSTLSLRRATMLAVTLLLEIVRISIHALLAESDTQTAQASEPL